MINKEINRKIAVILATDVVAYSKHMEQNESDTVKNLRSCEQILKITPPIALWLEKVKDVINKVDK